MNNQRIFKFRVWDSESKIMIPNIVFDELLLQCGCYDNKAYTSLIAEFSDYQKIVKKYGYNSDRMIIQQFTGLLDKNKKEIYEGDIIRLDTNQIGEIYYRPETLCYSLRHPISRAYRLDLYTFHDEHYNVLNGNLEIIGNIFENKDLVK